MVSIRDNSITVRKYMQTSLMATASSIYDDCNYKDGKGALILADRAFEIMNCQFEKERYNAHTFGALIDYDNRLNAMEKDLEEMEGKNE